MKTVSALIALALGAGLAGSAMAADTIVQFSRGIGVDPVAGIDPGTGMPVINTVRNVPPGGRPWVIRKLRASFYADGSVMVRGAGLLFSGGDNIGTTGPITQVKATLFCGQPGQAVGYDSALGDLDARGDFTIKGQMLQAPANPCVKPVLLIRNVAGAWFAAGIVGDED